MKVVGSDTIPVRHPFPIVLAYFARVARVCINVWQIVSLLSILVNSISPVEVSVAERPDCTTPTYQIAVKYFGASLIWGKIFLVI